MFTVVLCKTVVFMSLLICLAFVLGDQQQPPYSGSNICSL